MPATSVQMAITAMIRLGTAIEIFSRRAHLTENIVRDLVNEIGAVDYGKERLDINVARPHVLLIEMRNVCAIDRYACERKT